LASLEADEQVEVAVVIEIAPAIRLPPEAANNSGCTGSNCGPPGCARSPVKTNATREIASTATRFMLAPLSQEWSGMRRSRMVSRLSGTAQVR
jgi:hypothetical protein